MSQRKDSPIRHTKIQHLASRKWALSSPPTSDYDAAHLVPSAHPSLKMEMEPVTGLRA